MYYDFVFDFVYPLLITQVWASEDLEEMVCIGSIAELEALSGTKVADLHRETVDKLTIPSKRPGQHSFL